MTIDSAAQKIWDYMLLHEELEKADVILVPGNSDLRTIHYAAKLFLAGWAPKLLCSGSGSVNRARPGREIFQDKTEAEVFRDEAVKLGVPETAIIMETESQNTGDNISFSLEKLEELGVKADMIIAVMKPYSERRLKAIVGAQCPDIEFIVTSPAVSYADYPYGHVTRDYLINMMVGDLQRIKEYPKKGFQIEQNIPADVWAAYEFLVSKGYTERLIS